MLCADVPSHDFKYTQVLISFIIADMLHIKSEYKDWILLSNYASIKRDNESGV